MKEVWIFHTRNKHRVAPSISNHTNNILLVVPSRQGTSLWGKNCCALSHLCHHLYPCAIVLLHLSLLMLRTFYLLTSSMRFCRTFSNHQHAHCSQSPPSLPLQTPSAPSPWRPLSFTLREGSSWLFKWLFGVSLIFYHFCTRPYLWCVKQLKEKKKKASDFAIFCHCVIVRWVTRCWISQKNLIKIKYNKSPLWQQGC